MHFAACCGLLLGVVHGLLAVELQGAPPPGGLLAGQQAPWNAAAAADFSP